jgi:hypothetical protein
VENSFHEYSLRHIQHSQLKRIQPRAILAPPRPLDSRGFLLLCALRTALQPRLPRLLLTWRSGVYTLEFEFNDPKRGKTYKPTWIIHKSTHKPMTPRPDSCRSASKKKNEESGQAMYDEGVKARRTKRALDIPQPTPESVCPQKPRS